MKHMGKMTVSHQYNGIFRFTHDDIRDEAAWGLAELSWLYNRNEHSE